MFIVWCWTLTCHTNSCAHAMPWHGRQPCTHYMHATFLLPHQFRQHSPSIGNILKQFILLNESSPSFYSLQNSFASFRSFSFFFLGFSVGICTQFRWFGKWLFAYFPFNSIYEFILIKITLLATLVSIQMVTRWAHSECRILLFDSFANRSFEIRNSSARCRRYRYWNSWPNEIDPMTKFVYPMDSQIELVWKMCLNCFEFETEWLAMDFFNKKK